MLSADVIIIATGYKRPSIDFLPKDLFPKDKDHDYSPPSLYLQNFSVEDWSILMTNASYQDAIGTVGNWHIGIYARILMVFLLDESTRPVPFAMKSGFSDSATLGTLIGESLTFKPMCSQPGATPSTG